MTKVRDEKLKAIAARVDRAISADIRSINNIPDISYYDALGISYLGAVIKDQDFEICDYINSDNVEILMDGLVCSNDQISIGKLDLLHSVIAATPLMPSKYKDRFIFVNAVEIERPFPEFHIEITLFFDKEKDTPLFSSNINELNGFTFSGFLEYMATKKENIIEPKHVDEIQDLLKRITDDITIPTWMSGQAKASLNEAGIELIDFGVLNHISPFKRGPKTV